MKNDFGISPAEELLVEKFLSKVDIDIFEHNLNYELALVIWNMGLKEFNRRN
jgi:hypothetical protein